MSVSSTRKPAVASSYAASPMILSTGSMFEPTDVFNDAHFSEVSSELLPIKHETVDELSTHLPLLERMLNTSPFDIHSSVLDSVFSSSLEAGEKQDQTPMFEELDLMIEGGEMELKEDWVSLFGAEDRGCSTGSLELPSRKRSFDKAMISQEQLTLSTVHEESSVSPDAEQSQLCTPIQSALSTPLLEKSEEQRTKKQKVDSLGCIAYSKKLRSQPLPPIVANSSDPASLKRARNTEAARRSRARKLERMAQLEQRVTELLEEKSKSDEEIKRLKSLLESNGISF